MNSFSICKSIGAGLASLALSFAPVPAGALTRDEPAPAAPAAANLDKAVAALRAISTLRANFLQTDRNGQRATGVLSLKRPGKIRFQYEKSVPLLIVSDGKALTMVDYEVRQVQRWPIKNSPLGVLLDPNRDIARYGKLLPTQHPDVVSIEVRDPKRPEYGTITIIFVKSASAPGGLELTSWVALDSQNKRTTVRLSGHQYGVDVPDSAFKYTDPRIGTRPGGR
jgi:outer membrane lipoprotein-sorting protein